ncbi:hypothetical protein I4U23_004548 [Adineta vaga]|nr:hypothetical protein I4U23_004548 [Adineta vaga]
MSTTQWSSAFNTSEDVIEQFKTKLDELVEEATNNMNNEDRSSIEMTKVWQKGLTLWKTTINYLINSTTTPNVTTYEDCSYLFYNKIYNSLDFVQRLEKDDSLCYEVFYSCLDLLNMLVVNQHHLNSDDIDISENNVINNYFYIVLYLCRAACNYVLFSDELVNDYMSFLTILKAYADKKVTSELESEQEQFDRVTTEILIFFWCMANRTILVPSLILLNLPSSAVRWLSNSGCLNATATEPLIRIIYNMARHDDGADEYNNLGAMEIIKEYQRRDEIACNNQLSLCCSLAIAHLSTPEQLKQDQKGMNVVLNRLLELTMEAATKKDFTCEGVRYHVSHLVAVLAKLFVVDERTVDYIMTHAETEPPSNTTSNIKLFADLLIAFSDLITSRDSLNQFACIALYNIVWSISFQSEYQEELKANKQLIDTIQRLADDERSQMCDQYKPRALQSIKKAADGILYNLHLETNVDTMPVVRSKRAPIGRSRSPEQKDIKDTEISSDKKKQLSTNDSLPLVMFSYAHKDDKFCYHILKELEQMNTTLKVWIDIQQCAKGDLWEKIADAIENAEVILCFISEYYHQSKSCRQEFTYAVDDLQKPIIPILIGDYKPKGWLGIRKAGMKYIRFRNTNEPKQSEIQDLIERVRTEITHDKNIIINLTAPSHYDTSKEVIQQKSPIEDIHSTTVVFPPITEWTTSDIRQWFYQHGIMDEIHDLFRFQSGIEMLDYAQILVRNRDEQEKIYTQIFTQKYSGQLLPPHEFNRFVKAMEQLFKENSTEDTTNKETKQLTTLKSSKKSSTCMIL